MYAVILAGGSGTRLWPWSREDYPKQLLAIKGKSLYQETVLRLKEMIPYENIITVTHYKQRKALELQFEEIAAGSKSYFINEPIAKNTAPAIGLAAFYLYKKDPEAVMAVLPSDHHIELKDKYLEVLSKANDAAEKYGLVTFGIKPDRPETGYGYIYCGEELDDNIFKVGSFVEKPNLAKAKEFIKDSRFLWNSGMFVFKVRSLVNEYEKHLPEMTEMLKSIDYDTYDNLGEIYKKIEGTSIDYGIMEKSDKVTVVPADIGWNDIGSWESIYNLLSKDDNGNHIKGRVYSVGTTDSLVLGKNRVVGAIGLKDIIIVDTEDAVLVSRKDKVQDVKKVVELLKEEKADEYKVHNTVYRPWGSYSVLREGNSYKIKSIMVKPGERLSLQYHNHRSEHWVVVEGTARVTRDKEEIDLTKDQSIYLPVKSLHRLENIGNEDLEIIEVQNGDYLGEDDIVRVDDDYNRVEGKKELVGKDPCYKAYQEWLSSPFVAKIDKDELKGIKDEKEINDRFWRDLEFGTGGFRGIIGMGTNRMNIYVVRRATQGLANYMLREKRDKHKVVIAYDPRHKSREFAEETAYVFAGNGIKAYLFEDIRPTPELSYAIRKLGCTAGIVITASHNPPQYNGYKVYWEDGGQIVPSLAGALFDEINKVDIFKGVKKLDKEGAIRKNLFSYIGEEIDSDYIEEIKALSLYKGNKKDLKIVFTPLHGTGNIPIRRVLKGLGFEKVYLVDKQVVPDPNFSTVKYPNPEEPEVFKLALDKAREVKADIVLGTDPDCDRVGCVVENNEGEYVVLSGNQTGALLLDYILSQLKSSNKLPSNGLMVKTIVTSELGRKIADYYGIETVDTLTGFKFIGEKIKEFEEAGDKKFLFGYEESFGYLAGTFVRDKDAVIASMLIAEMAAYYKEKGITLFEALIGLYERFGYYKEDLVSIRLDGEDGLRQMGSLMNMFRKDSSSRIGEYKIREKGDYLTQESYNFLKNETFPLDLPKSDVLHFRLENDSWFCLRPSGTEPKMKIYFSVNAKSQKDADARLEEIKGTVLDIVNRILAGEADNASLDGSSNT